MYIHTSFILYHHKSMSEDDLLMTIASCVNQKYMPLDAESEVIILLDGVTSGELPLLYNIIAKRKNIIIVDSNETLTFPGAMWNYGFSISRGKTVCFLWTGVFWMKDSLYHLNNIIVTGGVQAAYSRVRYEQINHECSHDVNEAGVYQPEEPWLEVANILPLSYTLFTREAIELLGGFDIDISMSRVIDWKFMIKVNHLCKIGSLNGSFIPARQSLASIQYGIEFENSLDQNIKTNISVAIVSGIHEASQVQLCLNNYFEKIADGSSIKRKAFLEENINPNELKDYDIVFFVRSRYENAMPVAKYCYENNIKTVYIIDDNWFCALETYPQLGNQIGPNTIYFQNFILLISTVDYVLVYNDILKKDIEKYNDNVILFPTNINLDYFSKTTSPRNNQTINIGFAGSTSKIQFFTPAFNALEKIMDKYENVNLFFKGITLAEQLKKYGSRIKNTSYSFDYKKYAKEVSEWNLDIMISPLGETKYINSKCPNKYLEITACGAAGIYSENEVYKKYIKNGYNGLLIDNDEDSWLGALELLINNEKLRKRIISNAEKEIKGKFDTKVILPQFIKLLKNITKKKVKI
ncbi:MAG: hypothetical protein A2Y24_06685 [Clostridiales bacterium GWE2_32_10]|nr:MAG: hypothetical protein A2Y24_06685 [Clostridiales bacterium GWE2_32_10]